VVVVVVVVVLKKGLQSSLVWVKMSPELFCCEIEDKNGRESVGLFVVLSLGASSSTSYFDFEAFSIGLRYPRPSFLCTTDRPIPGGLLESCIEE
jgi:hypothetical protein